MAQKPKTKTTKIHRSDLAKFIGELATIKEFENLNSDVVDVLPDEILSAQQLAEAVLFGLGNRVQPSPISREEVAAMIALASRPSPAPDNGWQAAWNAQLLIRKSAAAAASTPSTGQTYTRGACWLGGGAPIVVPTDLVSIQCQVSGTITKATVITDGGTGSCVIDVWKDSYANYPPTVGDSICGGNKPTISTGIKYQDITLTGWTTSIAAGDILRFKLDSSSVFSSITITLEITP